MSQHSFDWTLPFAMVWGLLVLMALSGWGWLLGKWLIPEGGRMGWATAAAWGFVLFLALGGFLMAATVFSIGYVAFFLVAGFMLSLRHVIQDRKSNHRQGKLTSPLLKFWFGSIIFLALLAYAGAVSTHWYNEYDDLDAYFYLIRRLLDTGTIYDPFNFRMLGALGGQLVLSTLTLGFLPWKYGHMIDFGIAALMTLGLAGESFSAENKRMWIARLLLLTLVLVFNMPRSNTGSESTGVVLFALMFRTFDLAASGKITGWPAAVMLGTGMAAAVTLRCHNLFACGLFGACFVAIRLWQNLGKKGEVIRQAIQVLLVAMIFLGPWFWVSYRSGGTFLYPLMRGNHQLQFEIYNIHPTILGLLFYIAGFFLSTNCICFFLPLCFVAEDRQQKVLLVYGLALLFFIILFLSQFCLDTTLYYHALRYLVPIAGGFALYTAGKVACQLSSPGSKPAAGSFDAIRIKLAAVALILLQMKGFLLGMVDHIAHINWARDPKNELWTVCYDVGGVSTGQASREYEEAFSQLQPGAKTLVALDYPFLVDNQKYKICSVDIPGAASPPPGLPIYQGAEALKKYLVDHGFNYIAHVPFDKTKQLYGRDTVVGFTQKKDRGSHIFGYSELDFIDNVIDLEKSNPVVFNSSTIRIIKIK